MSECHCPYSAVSATVWDWVYMAVAAIVIVATAATLSKRRAKG